METIRFRGNLGSGDLLGLELLVGANLIGTITAVLTFTSVGLLAVIALIRTFLSFSLDTEIEDCWPWQRRGVETDPGLAQVDRNVAESYRPARVKVALAQSEAAGAP
jgi:hypothetical protein